MQTCDLTIVTTVDGTQNRIVREGEILNSFTSVELRYREENAFVIVRIKGESAEIERQGDYSLRLHLERGKECEGSIGIGGNEGSIQVFTQEIAYSAKEDSVLLKLQYSLLIGSEKQDMKLLIMAKIKKA